MGTYFSFQGRINSGTFIKAALALIVIGIVIGLAGQYLPKPTSMLLLPISIFLYWPWLAIWAKRYHDGDKSGWMVLLPILALFILSVVSTGYFMKQGMAAVGMTFSEFQDPAKAAAFEEAMKAKAMVMLPVNVVMQLLIIFGFNAMIKSDPEENRFGPPTS